MRPSFVITISALANHVALMGCTPSVSPAQGAGGSTAAVPEDGSSDGSSADGTTVAIPQPTATANESDPVPPSNPPPPPIGNPPPPPGKPAPTLANHPNVLNPQSKGKTMFVDPNSNGCYVEMPFPPGASVPPGSAPPRRHVACTPEIQDPAFQTCKGGTVRANADKTSCICFVMGNPPPPPKENACPST